LEKQGKVKAAIVGPGNIGTDLLYKLRRSQYLEVKWVLGIQESEGIKLAQSFGIHTSITGMEPMLEDEEVKIVFDATSAGPHRANAPLYKQYGKFALDLTPAAVGPYVVPTVNLESLTDEPNLNMVTCGGQATIPIVYAISSVAGAKYAEIVACISSKSAGPGTRQNIDEFTETTSTAICKVGGAKEGKAIIILNPADPPILMTNTVYVRTERPDFERINESVMNMVKRIQEYVPGYSLRVPPILKDDLVTVIVEVKGHGDFLPPYSGNLDIMTSASVATAERWVQKKRAGGAAI